MTQPLRVDARAREARERAELAAVRRDGALALEACDMLSELFGSGFRLFPLAEPSAVAAKPVRMHAHYDGACVACAAPIAAGDFIWWTCNVQGVACVSCGPTSAGSHG